MRIINLLDGDFSLQAENEDDKNNLENFVANIQGPLRIMSLLQTPDSKTKEVFLTTKPSPLIQEIRGLATQMAGQNNRGTQYPLFVVRHKVKVYGEEGWTNEVERREDGDGELCEKCEKLQEENDDLPDYCTDCDDTLFVHYNWEDKTVDEAGAFFTDAAAQRHIDANRHHYNQPFVFCTGAWRNPEMHRVMRWIFELAGVPMPNYYK